MYPNKTQAKQIDTLIHAAHVFYNMALYDMKENFTNTRESPSTTDEGKTVHFPDFKSMGKADYINQLRSQNEIIKYLPGAAISNIKCGLILDMQKAWEATGKHPVENFGKKYTDKDGIEHTLGCSFYSKKKPRTSYAYQTTLANIIPTDNPNIVTVKLTSRAFPVDGSVKVRGVNSRLRFDDNCSVDFSAWVTENRKKSIIIRVSKDSCGDYWIVFSLSNVYKPINVPDTTLDSVGIDVGEIDIASLSNGDKYSNVFASNPRIKRNQKSKEELDKKLSRSWGWRNPEFREAYKKDKTITPSKRYNRLDLKHKQVSSAIARQRADYYNKVTAEIISKADMIAIESLSVKEMFHSKDKEDAVES